MLLEYILLVMPVVMLIVKTMQWSGDFIVLTFFLSTAFIKLLII